jgi:hypothetical protein
MTGNRDRQQLVVEHYRVAPVQDVGEGRDGAVGFMDRDAGAEMPGMAVGVGDVIPMRQQEV